MCKLSLGAPTVLLEIEPNCMSASNVASKPPAFPLIRPPSIFRDWEDDARAVRVTGGATSGNFGFDNTRPEEVHIDHLRGPHDLGSVKRVADLAPAEVAEEPVIAVDDLLAA